MSDSASSRIVADFSKGLHELCFKVRNPALSYCWLGARERETDECDEREADECDVLVVAEGILEHDEVVVIGSDSPGGTRFQLSVRPIRGLAQGRVWWQRRNPLSERMPPDLHHFLSQEYEYAALADSPPTALCGCYTGIEDRKIDDQWWLDCAIPYPVYEALVKDLGSGLHLNFELRVRLIPSLVRFYADAGDPVTVGIPSLGKYGSHSAGTVTGVHWKVSLPTSARGQAEDHPEEALGHPRLVHSWHESNADHHTAGLQSAAQIAALGRTLRVGFVSLFLLLALFLLLR